MAIKFHLPDGSETDMVINSLKFFLVSNGEDFRDMFLAIAASPPGSPRPTKFEQFASAHPSVPAAAATIATPDSFADENYFGVNAFIFINKAGKRQAVRYQAIPTHLVHLSPADATKRAPDFLSTELTQRLKHGPVTFHLKAQLAASGDPTGDATKPWPDNRGVVDLGTITIAQVVPGQRRGTETSVVPADRTDRRHRGVGRPAHPAARSRLRGVVLASSVGTAAAVVARMVAAAAGPACFAAATRSPRQ